MNVAQIKNLFKNKLIKGGIYTTFCTFLNHAISMAASLFIFTNLLSTKDYGEVINYSLWLSIVTIIMTLNLSSSVVRGKTEFQKDFDGYLSSIFTLGTIVSLIFLAVVCIVKNPLTGIINMSSDMVVLLVINSFFMFIFNCYTVKLTATYNFKRYAVVVLAYNLLSVILSVVLIVFMKDKAYYGRIYGLFITSAFFALYFYAKQMKVGKKFIEGDYWKFALYLSVPLILHSLSGTILNYFDNLVIKQFESSGVLEPGATGLYGFGYKMALIISMLWTALNKVWVPWFFDKMKEKDYRTIREVQKYYIGVFTLIFSIFIMIIPEFLLLINNDYRVTQNIIPIISLGYYFLFLYSLPSNVEFYHKKTQFMSFGAMISVIINVGLNIIFIPRYGYDAAAVTTLISYIVLFVYHYIIVKFVLHENILVFKNFAMGVCFAIGSVLLYYIYVENIVIRYLFVVLAVVLSSIFFYKNGRQIIRKKS